MRCIKIPPQPPFIKGGESNNILDQWIVALLNKTRNEMTNYLDSYELDKATKLIGDFIEDLSTWYIRRSRDRFKNNDQEALGTTYYVLLEFSKLIAPFIPFLAEDLYKKLNGPKESVHLESWPSSAKASEGEARLLDQMKEVRRIVSIGLELRNQVSIKVRQPLSRFEIREDSFDIGEEEGLLELIKDELNVKEVIFDANISEDAKLDTEITEKLKKEGIAREIIRTIQDLRKEKGLQPGEKIEVSIRSSSDIHHIVKEFEEMISKVTFVTNFLFEETNDKDFEIKIV